VKRRLLISNVVLVAIVLVLLEVPLALVYARHEHDAVDSALQRDASSLAALSEEIIEHPGDHDVGALAQRFTTDVGDQVAIVDRNGANLAPTQDSYLDADFGSSLRDARAGRPSSGEAHGLSFVVVPVGANSDTHGAVLVARSDEPADQRIHLFWLALLGIGAGVLLTSVLVSRRLARWTVDPLRRLDEQAAELGRGDLAARADIASGPPEVIALSRTFNDMASRLNELITSQRRFVADASHQLRTPLTALRLRLETLDPHDPSAVSTTRDAALQESARLTRVVDGLLALARAEGHRPQRQSIDVAVVIAQRHEAWTPLAAEHDVELRLANDDDDVTASIVPGHLEQILDNLIDNALDATPAGRSVTLWTRATETGVEIHVTDEGTGMTDDERQRAFDPFWQSNKHHPNGNTGLGLAIVDQLVRTSSGLVTLERAPVNGIDAIIRFPATTD
jgi:signal transduction histidine kinase